MERVARRTMRAVIAISAVLAVVKVAAGWWGTSWALVADGIESSVDILGGLVVWSGLRIASRPADEDHPYGHGKAETLSAAAVSLLIIGAGVLIAVQAVREIAVPQEMPASWTLYVLAGVIVIKEVMYRWLRHLGERLDSRSLLAEAWHHRGDAITSAAAFIGITIAVIGGEDYAQADDWAALLACGVIFANGMRLLKRALDDLMDRSADPGLVAEVRSIAGSHEGVVRVEKCRVRKAGLGLHLDIHVQVPGATSVFEGHRIGHQVQDRLMASELPIEDVIVHLEPAEQDDPSRIGRFSADPSVPPSG
ncbi:MAG: cation diffusion facilitator family transporter [Planctomycetota bacterium]|nr:cation diffusion facilitator family transporter [Planctomycetota bacterium]